MAPLIGLMTDVLDPRVDEYIEWIVNLGGTPLLIVDKDVQIPLSHQSSLTLIVRDLKMPGQTTEELAQALLKNNLPLTRLLTFRDRISPAFILSSRALALGLDDLAGYINCRLKIVTRQMLTPCLTTCLHAVHSIFDSALPSNTPTPFIAKPLSGAGSSDVAIINTIGEWDVYTANLRGSYSQEHDCDINGFKVKTHILVEQLLRGEEYEVDGYVHAGEMTICAIGRKIHRYIPEVGFRELGGYLWRYGTNKSKPDTHIKKWLEAALHILQLDNSVFHAEVMIDPKDDRIDLVEINPRPGGGGVVDMVRDVTGVNLVEEAVRLKMGFTPRSHPSNAMPASLVYAIRYPEDDGVLKYIAPRLNIKVSLFGHLYQGRWIPYESQGSRLVPNVREQYLGELTVQGEDFGFTTTEQIVTELQTWLMNTPLIIETRGA